MMKAIKNKIMNVEVIFIGISCWVEIKTKPMKILFLQNNNLLKRRLLF
jgi:hypothetical protein